MKNFFAFTLILFSTIVMASNCEAFQGPPGREGGPRGERGGPGGERGQRGGPAGERGQRGGPGGERGQRGGPGGERGGFREMEIPIILALDADKDGKISSAEMANAATALATLDKNEDGVLEFSEMMPERGGRRGGPGGGGPRGGEGGASGFVDRMMQNDTDGDGKISADEAPDRMQGFFERLDGDGDGFLTEEEITEASNRWSGGGGRGGRDGGGRGGRGGGGDGGGQRPKRPASE